MLASLRSAWSGVATVGLTGAFSSAVAASTFFDERWPDPLIHAWARSVLKASGVRTVAEGLEHLPPDPFVLVLNHQSHFDSVVMFRHVERHLRFVVKAELGKVPLLGLGLRRSGNIFVERRGSQSDRARLHEAVGRVKQRVSVAFFAEGTRSGDGVLMPFKKGAAVMALESGVPLVPAAVAGTRRILEKGSLFIHPHPAALVIGRPIETAGLSLDARDALTQQAHDEVARLLERGNVLVTELSAGVGTKPARPGP